MLQVQAVVPLMALVFPVVWRLLDLYGIAKIDLAFDDIIRHKVVVVPYYLQEISLTHCLCVKKFFGCLRWNQSTSTI